MQPLAQEKPHIPVMLDDVLHALSPKKGDVVVDATFGAGGYTRALLQAQCKVFAIDRDPSVKLLAEALAREFPGHFFFLEGCFGDMAALLQAQNVAEVNGVVMDLGVSSMQLDQAERGFSFNKDAPLDMRMGTQSLTAFEVVNHYDEAELARIFKDYGEERFARKIARHIVAARVEKAIETTKELAALVAACLPKSREKIHPATRVFQAVRIEVNAELEELSRVLLSAKGVLADGGKLVAVSFHSLEDRIVKQFLKKESSVAQEFSRHDPRGLVAMQRKEEPVAAAFEWPRPHKIYPKKEEVQRNPRARSAILRMAVRVKGHSPGRTAHGRGS